jgi:pyruvate formate lyase activating enzyme
LRNWQKRKSGVYSVRTDVLFQKATADFVGFGRTVMANTTRLFIQTPALCISIQSRKNRSSIFCREQRPCLLPPQAATSPVPDHTANYELGPRQIVDLAIRYKTPTIAYTYTEPTVFFEYMLDTAKQAREKGILNIYHSNGYINQTPLRELAPYLDGANIDLKGYSNEFYQDITGGFLDPVLETLKTLKQQGVWLEITNLVIPNKNDSDTMLKNMCTWIKQNLGNDTPVHFSRFYPQYKLQSIPPTPIETLKKAAEIAHGIGIDYVYIGNVPGLKEENTYCPSCGKLIIARKGYRITEIHLTNGKCKFCKAKISGKWH